MSSTIPIRLLCHSNGQFRLIDTRSQAVPSFDIISYRWGQGVTEYSCEVPGVHWNITLSKKKVKDIMRLMKEAKIQYLWCDALCINQEDEGEKNREIAKMHEYYKNARTCHILIHMKTPWNPQKIVDDLSLVDQFIYALGRVTRTSEKSLEPNLREFMSVWSKNQWKFPLAKETVQSAAVDMAVLNCYSTCAGYVKALFRNLYFTRVWTFQEMLLGRNITMWGVNLDRIDCIGELETWMNLASDAKDKALKIKTWIADSREEYSEATFALLGTMEEDLLVLEYLDIHVRGISAARMDIITGGPYWWVENHRGISNVFSAISWRPRKCSQKPDIFRGLLGIFHGLFTPEEIDTELSSGNIDDLSFAFFKKLSEKTKYAWTRLVISSGERTDHNWIPRVTDYLEEHSNNRKEHSDYHEEDLYNHKDEKPPAKDDSKDVDSEDEIESREDHNKPIADCFAGVIRLGIYKEKDGLAKTEAFTGIEGTPRKYMTITFRQNDHGLNTGMNFTFKGCNCGKRVKTGTFKSELIPTYDQPVTKAWGETGRTLVECATILGGIFNPGEDVVTYRRRLLTKLQPQWIIHDANAKPAAWIDRCVNGTDWENPEIRVHNHSMNYNLKDWIGCRSRLHNEHTKNVICEIRVNCGCVVSGPFSLIMEGITAVQGSSLGEEAFKTDSAKRIHLHDGLGLVQLGDVSADPKVYNLICFGGKDSAYKNHADICRKTKDGKPIEDKVLWPSSRALVKEEFNHSIMRDYGYVDTGGSGGLLICRNHIADDYKIIGVCIDGDMKHKKDKHFITIK
ncbi:hypothetical protein ACMFMG_006961 [Clarireedia jacksonii]